jgi:hypothetical protein
MASIVKINPNFWDEVENQYKLKYILYGDTDSLYIHVPEEYEDGKDAWNKIEKYAIEINNIIEHVLDNNILPKMNISKEYNRTDFKTESIITSMLLLDAKKHYAYKEIAKKGQIHKKPKIKFTGLPIKKVNFSKFTRDFLNILVEEIALSETYKGNEFREALSRVAQEQHILLTQKLQEFDFRFFGSPAKWKTSEYKKDTDGLIGMKLYNTIMQSPIFRPGLSGYKTQIIIKDVDKFLKSVEDIRHNHENYIRHIDYTKISAIVVPFNYEPNVIKEKFKLHYLDFDFNKIWEGGLGKSGQSIVEIIKNHVL